MPVTNIRSEGKADLDKGYGSLKNLERLVFLSACFIYF